MSELKNAESFRDLLIYQKALQLARQVFKFTSPFLKEEAFSLTDQVRRSARSVGAQIAEAWAKRRYERHFISKLTDADGELQETLHWLGVALDYGYMSQAQIATINADCTEIGRMVYGMIEKAHLFCADPQKAIHEQIESYDISEIDD
jgi:four helix bundle protein